MISLLFVANLAAQNGEITEKKFNAITAKAEKLQKESSYIQTRTLEYFEDSSKPGRVSERDVDEVLLSGKWRKIEERNYGDKPTKSERIWDGKSLYSRDNEGAWQKYSGGGSVSGGIQTGQFTFKYSYLGQEKIDEKVLNLYEVRRDRIARKPSATGITEFHYVRLSKYWFLPDGRLAKKLEEETVEGFDALSRETTTIEYDPKGLKIEAPIK